MVLVGGPPGAGKSTLGRALAARLGFASTSADDLAIAARSFGDPARHPALHPMGGRGHVDYFTAGPPERLVADAEALSGVMWEPLSRVIRSHVASGDPLVLDWWLLSPALVAGLDGPVASVWLHVDPDVLDRREREQVDFRAGSSDPERMHRNFMARSLWRNEVVAAEARALGLAILHQDGTKSVESLVDEALVALGP